MVPTICQQPPTFFFQETHFVDSDLQTISLAKAVPNGIKDKECKRFAL
jgi:hypothetical protein